MELEKLLSYGWQVLVIALIIVVIIGVVKTFLKAKWGGKSEVLKAVYQTLSVVLSLFGAMIYCKILGTPLASWAFFGYVVSVLAAVQVLYGIYENYGLRKLFQVFVSCLVKIFTEKPPAGTAEGFKEQPKEE